MESLLRVNSKANLSAIENAIKESLPPRSYNELNLDQRQDLFAYVESSSDDFLLTLNDEVYYIYRLPLPTLSPYPRFSCFLLAD